jgi:hypothetical protein
MPDDWTESVKDEWAALVVAAWPEVIPSPTDPELVRGVYIAEHVENIPLDKIEPPYAVISIPDWPREMWATDALTFEPIVEFYYVMRGQGSTAPMRNQMALLRDLLYPDPPGSGLLELSQVLEIVMFSTSRSVPLNDALKRRGAPAMAGMISARILGEKPT